MLFNVWWNHVPVVYRQLKKTNKPYNTCQSCQFSLRVNTGLTMGSNAWWWVSVPLENVLGFSCFRKPEGVILYIMGWCYSRHSRGHQQIKCFSICLDLQLFPRKEKVTTEARSGFHATTHIETDSLMSYKEVDGYWASVGEEIAVFCFSWNK